MAAYVPEGEPAGRFRRVALLSNGGLQAEDRHGNEIRFNPAWQFESLLPAPDRRMVQSLSMGGRTATFSYTIDHDGTVVIAAAALGQDQPNSRPTGRIEYEYDAAGRLCSVQRPHDAPSKRLACR